MYIKINNVKYQLFDYNEDIDDIDKMNNEPGEHDQVLYVKMIIPFEGDNIIQLRNDIRSNLKKDGYVFIVYNDDNTPAFSYEHAYLKMVRRNVNVKTGSYSSAEVVLKIYLDNET